MSCISHTYNCTVKWIIENFSVFLNQVGDSFCVPQAEFETLNHGKWTLTLKKSSTHLKFFIRRETDASILGETVVNFRVSIVGTDKSLYLSQISSGVNIRANTTEIGNVLFQLDDILNGKLLPSEDIVCFGVEIRFCDSNPLELNTKIRTKLLMERSSFTCSASKFQEFLQGNILSFPIDVHLERSPNFKLVFQSDFLMIHKRSGFENRHNIVDARNASEDCDVLLHVKISELKSQKNVQRISNWLFFKSSRSDDKRKLLDWLDWNCGRVVFENDVEFWATGEGKTVYEYWGEDVRCEFSFADGKYGTLLEERDYSHPFDQNQTPEVRNKRNVGHSLFKEPKFMDVTLEAGGRTFKAHKAVLCSASPVFSAMFDHEMKEQETGTVCIEDVKPHTLKRMLRFMYTDSIDGDASFEEVAGLFAAANKYQMCSLKDHCSSRLISLMCSENVCRVLHLAYMHDNDEMKQAAKVFFCKDPAKVLNSEEWKTFMEDSIRGRAAKSSTALFINPHRLRRSLSNIRGRISKMVTRL